MSFSKERQTLTFIALASLLLLASFPAHSFASALTLAWDPNTEPDLAGYKVYYGTQSGIYDFVLDVGNVTQYTVTDLEPDTLYYFAATAYDTSGNESDFSSEVSGLAPNPTNEPPVADAGPDKTVNEGVTVTLDGSNSSDPDDGIASYLWEQTGGIAVTLSDPAQVQPTFTSPDVGPDGESLVFQLTVTDNGGLQSIDDCIVNVTSGNAPPVADAGSDQLVDEGLKVILDASNSSDPDDGIASYLWKQRAGIAVTLSDSTSATPTFVSPSVDGRTKSLSFQVTVTDYGGLQDSDEALVTVEGDSEEWYSEFGCFIATAAYGSALSDEVDVFKQFRDQYLLTNEFGRAFVSVYYRYSPTLAGYIAKHPMIRKIVRIGLYPVLRLSKWFVDENPSR